MPWWGRELQEHVNVFRDFLILRYFTNITIVCPPSWQNFFLEDMEVAFHFLLLMDLKSTSLLLTLCAFQERETCYSAVKSNQTYKCQTGLLWPLHYF